MDICVVTNDALLARFLILELAEAGFHAEQRTDFASEADLYLCDLDFYVDEVPEETVGFSYDENKRRRVQSFLHRPIDAEKLRFSERNGYGKIHRSRQRNRGARSSADRTDRLRQRQKDAVCRWGTPVAFGQGGQHRDHRRRGALCGGDAVCPP